MNEVRVDLPPDVRAELARRAGSDPAAAAEWIVEAVRERLAASAHLESLAARGRRGTRAAFERVLSKVRAAPPLPGDELQAQ